MFEDSPELLFEEISRIVKHEMYHDPWKRFLRTKVCEKIIFKYQNDSMICSPQITEKFNYTDEYFEHPFIYKQDFKFSEELMKDSFDWELIGRHDESEMNTYFSKLNYLPGVKLSKNAKALKFECVIPISLQRFVLSYSTFESASKSDPNITRMESLGYYEYETLREKFKEKGIEENLANFQHNLMIGVADVVFSYPLNPRVSYQATTMTYDPETQTLIATGKPFMHDGIRFNEPIQLEVCPKTGSPMKKMKVYPFFDFFFLKYQQIDEEKVLFSQVHIMDSGGWTNNDAIIKMIAKSRGNKFRETLTNLIKEWPEKAKIEEYKEMICKLKENGNYSDGLGKLLYDLKIDEKNEEFLIILFMIFAITQSGPIAAGSAVSMCYTSCNVAYITCMGSLGFTPFGWWAWVSGGPVACSLVQGACMSACTTVGLSFVAAPTP
eukprot:gene10993-3699_t